MHKKLIFIGAIALIIPAIALATKPNDQGEHKQVICHRTNSVTNPYVAIEVDYSAIDSEGESDHMGHTGPVPQNQEEAQALKDAKTKFGDIIPPVEGVTDGLNWAEGFAIFHNDCKYVPPVTEDEGTHPRNEDQTPTGLPADKTAPTALPSVGGHGTLN